MERVPLAQRPNMPRYQSHKIVGALRIAAVSGQTVTFEPATIGLKTFFFDPFEAAPEMFLRYTPTAGDYYVVYEDGYDSFSPRKAFEEGYVLAPQEQQPTAPQDGQGG